MHACMHAWYTKLTKHVIQTCLQGTIPRDSSNMFQDLRLWWVLGCPPVGTDSYCGWTSDPARVTKLATIRHCKVYGIIMGCYQDVYHLPTGAGFTIVTRISWRFGIQDSRSKVRRTSYTTPVQSASPIFTLQQAQTQPVDIRYVSWLSLLPVWYLFWWTPIKSHCSPVPDHQTWFAGRSFINISQLK